jgi:hypothetical protein
VEQKVDVMRTAAEGASTGERISLAMETESLVPSDDLAFEAIAFATAARTTHRRAPRAGGALPNIRKKSLSAWRVMRRRPPTRTD